MDMTVTLDRLCPGQTARILKIQGEDAMCRRLLDLGFTPGTEVMSLNRAASGDPTAYRIRGAVIALRSVYAANILATKCGGR